MQAKVLKSTALASIALLFASCASDPYYANSGYGGSYGGQAGGIDVPKTAALVAAGVAGLSLYHYGKEKDKRKEAERKLDRHNRYHHDYRRGYDRYNRYDRYDRGRRW
ncbi:hypothetical protein [Roseibacillus ishigakijimensis]|uniref:Lipoprotein n=1 Tax=Roseibacillus ishigakijimensis TaxID=454146 RepID=A0A934RRY7_9BACT|nr:hypothetical protein [Roseibacillus ishigakijimensis]MBK1833145.1 hypothetical protein [Roseibacillus ishigakijimensis]